ESQSAAFHFTFDGTPEVQQTHGGVMVSLDGEGTWVTTGEPIVPVHESTILLPQGMEITSVEVTHLDAGRVIAGGVELAAAPAAFPFAGGLEGAGEPTPVEDSFGGGNTIAYSNHTLNGYRLGTLRVFPVAFDAGADTLTHHSETSLLVTVGPGGDGATVVGDSQVDRLRVAQLVDNPEALDGYTPSATQADGSSALLPASGQYEYVIITAGDLQQSFQPLVNQKSGRGLSATMVTTETIYANYSGTEIDDQADRIRSFVADAHANWGTRWVLLGGDVDVIPQRGVYASVGSIVENDLPTDLYYACLDGTWNGDGDGLWGEYGDGTGGGDVDLVAEVYIGRAPVSNAAEAANFVSKTIQYETTLHPNATTAVWLGEQLDESTWGSYSSIPIRENALPDDWNVVEHYDSAGGWNKSALVNDLNAGPHLVNHLGHANEVYNARLVSSDVAGLTNEQPYFMYSQGCLSGSFDTHDVAIAEQHVTGQYGAFSVVMNSRYGWYIPGDTPGGSHYYAMEFWDAAFNEGLTRLGEANQDSKDDNLFRVGSTGAYRWIHFETNLFGDPETSLQIGDGFTHRGEIRGTVIEDANRDGQPQPGENPLAGHTVFLDSNQNGVLDQGTVHVASSDAAVPIEDNGTVTATLEVAGAATVGDLNVSLDVSHTYDGDLAAYLISPLGTRVELFSYVGGWGDNFTDTVFDDEADASIADAEAPFTGSFRPEGRLSMFDGQNPNGTWTLEITDAMSWDVGTLNHWSLEITGEERATQTDVDGTYAFTSLAGGTYHVRHVLPQDWSHTDPIGGVHAVSVGQAAVVEGVDFLAREDFVIPPTTDLGQIDSLDVTGTAGDASWYTFQATHQGYLTLVAYSLASGDAIQLALYDAEGNELVASDGLGASARIDWIADAGETFHFHLSGTAEEVDVRLTNLVRQEGSHVTVYGTGGDDRFEFAAGDQHQVEIHRASYRFDSSQITSVAFDGGAGTDVAILYGSHGADDVVMHPNRATMTGTGYRVDASGAESIIAVGQAGDDVAHLYDSAANDRLTSTPDSTVLSGTGFWNRVMSFRYVYAHATAGGIDAAIFHDSAGDDRFVAAPEYAVLHGADFYNRGAGFRYVYAYATGGGDDIAELYDSPGNDRFKAFPGDIRLYGDHFSNRAVAFRYVHAYATAGGDDIAELYDSPGGDRFTATPEYGALYGDSFYARAVAFRYVHA
ncbi:MAG: C25 family cysteine peptidase, partial [Planctomycetota bacterium]